MHQGQQKDDADHKVWHFDIVVSDGFVLIEVAAITDLLRIANRTMARAPFKWTFRSAKGGRVASYSGPLVETEPFIQKPEADFAFVIGNSNPDTPALSLTQTISAYTYRGAKVYLLAEAASRYIRDLGPEAEGHTTHWENSIFLRERLGMFDAGHALASETGPIITCAGMGATIDVVLALIGRLTSSATQMTAANVMLHENIRDFGSLQPFSGVKPTITGDSDLDHCIRIMQDNMEEPVPINEIVDMLGISTRSLERKFKTFLRATPNTFYREMRLSKANNLLLNTTLSVREIGLACGFPSGFSGLYKSFFGVTPFTVRKSRRAGASGE
ncbi:helix-turn-helix domain-containing protein [Rhodobacteraceae bacterium M382]|nr:helix-turn-helix domain-containing protein [Rhodobacteraceae bacterium M382]